MAQRRMMSLKIIDTDKFLEMPLSTQCLYFHLLMRADDDGFIGNTKKIMRIIGSSDDDLKILFAKQYIIPFESGVCVIKDWKIHNYIQKDRYDETIYTNEKSQLELDENASYNLISNECIQNVYKLDTQDRLGKVSIGEDKEEKEILPHNHIDEFLFAYKEICTNLPQVRELSSTRRNKVKARLKDAPIETWREVFTKMNASKFCCGENDRKWTASFDWIIANDNNYIKVLEGKYDTKKQELLPYNPYR